jgi:hypothetical protein
MFIVDALLTIIRCYDYYEGCPAKVLIEFRSF